MVQLELMAQLANDPQELIRIFTQASKPEQSGELTGLRSALVITGAALGSSGKPEETMISTAAASALTSLAMD